jgi:hypothetical protein
MPGADNVAIPRLIIGEQRSLERALKTLESLVTCYPYATSLVAQAVVREGRAYARRPEGQRLMRELSGSEWVERGRILWEACGIEALLGDAEADGDAGGMLPSAWLRLIYNGLSQANLEETLSRLMRG